MINIIQSEYLKYKRTFMRRLILLAPLFFIIIMLIERLVVPDNYLRPWDVLIVNIYNWWPVTFIPIGTALFAVLVQAQEKRAGNYRSIRTHDISPSAIWIGKIIVMAIHTLFATFVLMLAIIISGLIVANGVIPWFKILISAFIIWITSLAVIPLQLWIATWKGIFVSIAMGILGLIAGSIAAVKPYWVYVPWSWPTRLMCPIIGVHPNGTLLKANDPLLNSSVIVIGIIVSLAALIIFTFITTVWFERREVQ